MTTTLFDLRSDLGQGLIRSANDLLAAEDPDYHAKFGLIGSARWWRHYDAHEVPRTLHVGEITYIGAGDDIFDEEYDIIRIRTDTEEIVYERTGFWLDPTLVVGARLHIESVQMVVPTRTGPVTLHFDVRIWLDHS